MDRRQFLLTAVSAGVAGAAPKSPLIDTHIHLFGDDQKRFPYHTNAVYRAEPSPVESYVKFAKEAKIDHTIVVHPEPYQDDHRYLEYCFANEHITGIFQGNVPVRSDRQGHARSHGRTRTKKSETHRGAKNSYESRARRGPTKKGPIRDRDLKHPAVKTTIQKAQDLGLAIEMHCIPLHAPEIAALARDFSKTRVYHRSSGAIRSGHSGTIRKRSCDGEIEQRLYEVFGRPLLFQARRAV